MLDNNVHGMFCEFIEENTQRETVKCLQEKNLYAAWKRYCNVNDLPKTTWKVFHKHVALLDITKDRISKNLDKSIMVVKELAWKDDAEYWLPEFKSYPVEHCHRYNQG